jgi:hypothetical protein
VFVGTELAIFGAWVVLEVAVVSVHSLGLWQPLELAAWAALHLAFLWLFAGLALGLHTAALQVVDGEPPSWRGIASQVRRGGGFLSALLLYLLAVAAGLCLLIVPGLVLAARWALFSPVLATEPVSGPAALRRATALSAGHSGRLLRLVLASAGINLVGAALLGIGFLVSYPVTVLLASLFYRALAPCGPRPGGPFPGGAGASLS